MTHESVTAALETLGITIHDIRELERLEKERIKTLADKMPRAPLYQGTLQDPSKIVLAEQILAAKQRIEHFGTIETLYWGDVADD